MKIINFKSRKELESVIEEKDAEIADLKNQIDRLQDACKCASDGLEKAIRMVRRQMRLEGENERFPAPAKNRF